MLTCRLHYTLLLQELRDLAYNCCLAAQTLHAAGLVHRDIRLPNVVRVVSISLGCARPRPPPPAHALHPPAAHAYLYRGS